MSESYINFETRKSVHINLTRETHTALRTELFRHHLSMQEVFEEVARQIIEKHEYTQDLLSELSVRKRDKATVSLSKTDAESIFKVIADSSQLDSGEK